MNTEPTRKPYVWSERAALKAAAHEWRCIGAILTGIGLAAILMACWRFGFVWLAVVSGAGVAVPAAIADHPAAAGGAIMTEELFPLETVQGDSPRLQWIKKHGIRTKYLASSDRWEAHRAMDVALALEENTGYAWSIAKTEDGALADLARQLGLKLWNEEGAS